MKTEDSISKNINTAFWIYERCENLNLSIDAARVFVYIHFRIINNLDEDIDYSEIVKVIDFLIDNGKLDVFSEKSMQYNIIEDIPRKMKRLDRYLPKDHGMEVRIFSELNNRVRIYRDRKYRKKMILLYRDKILPSLVDREMAS